LKQHLYISSFLLILIVSLGYLSDYSVNCAGNLPDKQYLEIRKLSDEKGSLKATLDFDLWKTASPSVYAYLPEGTLVQKNINLFGLLMSKFLSNPSLIDLPPPTS